MDKEKAIKICRKIIQQNNEIVKQARKNNDINEMQLTANCDTESKAIETILNYIENSIDKSVVAESLNKLQEEYELLLEHQNGQESNRTKYLRGKIHMCQELLQKKGEK